MYAQNGEGGDVQLIVIGVVVDVNDGNNTVGNVRVELINTITNDRQIAVSTTNGSFKFNVIPDQNYQLFANKAKPKVISTINKNLPEILYAILELNE